MEVNNGSIIYKLRSYHRKSFSRAHRLDWDWLLVFLALTRVDVHCIGLAECVLYCYSVPAVVLHIARPHLVDSAADQILVFEVEVVLAVVAVLVLVAMPPPLQDLSCLVGH